MSCFKKLQFKPKEIGENIERETKCHKIKVVGWSTFMLCVSVSYMSYFSGLTQRADQMQNQALAGQLTWNEYEPFYSDGLMAAKIYQDIVSSKDSKDLKYIVEGWKSQEVFETDSMKYYGPQGSDDTKGWYTQTERVGDHKETIIAKKTADATLKQTDPVAWAQLQYDTWTTMHDASVSWFDTAGCHQPADLVAQHGYIGIVNQPVFVPISPWFENASSSYTGWWVGDEEYTAPKHSDTREIDWSTQLMTPAGVKITVSDDLEMFKRNLQNTIDIMEDCDLDCQAKGSQLTLVASLNVSSLVLIVFTSLMGILGGWSKCGRITQTYCSFIAFFLQFAVLVYCGTLLFTPYAKSCFGSMQPTFSKDSMWTMHDDYVTVIGLWGSQFLWMFLFFIISMCGAFRVEK